MVKGKTIFENETPIDFWYQFLIGNVRAEGADDYENKVLSAQESGEDLELEFEATFRDGTYDEEQMYAVYTEDEIVMLMKTLMNCKGI